MYTEDSNTGFLGGLKSLFSAKKTNTAEEITTSVGVADVLVEEYIPVKNPNIDAPTDKPMGTRTVDYSHTEHTSVGDTPPAADATVNLITDDNRPHQDLDILFASMLIEKGGKFIYCETIADAVTEVKALAVEMKWAHVFCWENEIKDAFCENNFQKGAIGFTLENSNVPLRDSGGLYRQPDPEPQAGIAQEATGISWSTDISRRYDTDRYRPQ